VVERGARRGARARVLLEERGDEFARVAERQKGGLGFSRNQPDPWSYPDLVFTRYCYDHYCMVYGARARVLLEERGDELSRVAEREQRDWG